MKAKFKFGKWHVSALVGMSLLTMSAVGARDHGGRPKIKFASPASNSGETSEETTSSTAKEATTSATKSQPVADGSNRRFQRSRLRHSFVNGSGESQATKSEGQSSQMAKSEERSSQTETRMATRQQETSKQHPATEMRFDDTPMLTGLEEMTAEVEESIEVTPEESAVAEAPPSFRKRLSERGYARTEEPEVKEESISETTSEPVRIASEEEVSNAPTAAVPPTSDSSTKVMQQCMMMMNQAQMMMNQCQMMMSRELTSQSMSDYVAEEDDSSLPLQSIQ